MDIGISRENFHLDIISYSFGGSLFEKEGIFFLGLLLIEFQAKSKSSLILLPLLQAVILHFICQAVARYAK